MTEKKVTKKVVTPKKATINPDAMGVIAAILMTKGHPTASALENAKIILEDANELIGK